MRRNAPTILLTNFHSQANAGDAALLQIAAGHLRAAFDSPRLIVAANYPAEAGLRRLGVEVAPSPGALAGCFEPASPWRQLSRLAAGLLAARPGRTGHAPPGWQPLLAAYTEADLVISCAGNPFFSMGRFGWPLLVSASALWLALRCQKPLYLLPQSLGPFRRPWEARLMSSLCRRARLVFVREPLSLRQAQGWGLPAARLRPAPDLAFDFPPAGAGEAAACLRRWGWSPHIPAAGVTALPRLTRALTAESLEAAYRALGIALGRLCGEHGVRLFFFPQSSGPTTAEDDRLAARRVMARLPPAASAVLIDEPLEPALLKACYGQMQRFIASRLHSGIFALGMGTPALFIGYLSKTRGVLESLGLQDWLVELEAACPERLSARIDALWQEGEAQRAALAGRLPLLAAEARCAASQIAEDFRGNKP